jgi:Fur family transcriptional regulator, ferric uptake regulator
MPMAAESAGGRTLAGTGAGDQAGVRPRAAVLAPTPRRRHVLRALAGLGRPASAHELYLELARQGHRVGLATVYRTLAALTGGGQPHVFIRDGEARFMCLRER